MEEKQVEDRTNSEFFDVFESMLREQCDFCPLKAELEQAQEAAECERRNSHSIAVRLVSLSRRIQDFRKLIHDLEYVTSSINYIIKQIQIYGGVDDDGQ